MRDRSPDGIEGETSIDGGQLQARSNRDHKAMQIIQTEVAQVTSASGHPVLRVHFRGEGGECVTVDMASDELPDDGAAIERAKAILVQTATFGSAANEYDAQSNGDFDEVSVTSASSEDGGVYIFEYRDGDGVRHVPPCNMPSREAARDEAIRCAVDLLVDLQPGQDPLTGWLVRVRDENGELLDTVDVQEAEAARMQRQ